MALSSSRILSVVLLLVTSRVTPALARSGGAPQEACSNLTPQHGSSSTQTTTSPYTITFTPSTFTAGGSPVTVTLTTTSGSAFQGFLLTTQYEGPNVDQSARPGTFGTLPTGTRFACNNQAVTHSTRNTGNSLAFQWTPPATSGGNVRFRATFVRSFSTFWVDVRSADLLMDTSPSPQSGNSSTAAPQSTPPSVTASTIPPTTTGAPPAAAGQVQRDAECGRTKGCYSDCKGNTCNFLVSWAQGATADTVKISMSGVVGSSTGRYIALGMSEDNKMGSDSVVHCINAAKGAFLSYNINNGKVNQLSDQPKNGLSDIQVTFQDGVLTCSFSRLKAADSAIKRFALTKPYTLFFATGPSSGDSAQYHEKTPLISTQAASLVDFAVNIGGSADFPLIKAHGSLMIAAWIFAASIGIILARYFKEVWQESTWFGQKIWFQIHRACMVLALLSTAAAFIIIFVEIGGYSDIQGEGYKKAHPILGIIVTALTVINPTMALFRPHPGTPRRPIFNWAHWMVGTGAHVLGVITIFFGVLLGKSGAPKYIIYILAAYVGWQVLIQILMEIVQCMGRNSNRSEAYEMTDVADGGPLKVNSKKEASFAKRLLLFLHIVVISGFTVALIVVLVIGKPDN